MPIDEKNKTFCMLPWTHLYVMPNGDCKPCCVSKSPEGLLGNTHKDTIAELRNHDIMKDLRVQMLKGEKSDICYKCYEAEAAGFFGDRLSSNRDYGQHYDEVIPHTQLDGYVPEEYLKMRRLDIRFSNVCNFRCRMCGPLFSSRWYNDHIKLFPEQKGSRILRPTFPKGKLMEQVEEFIDEVDLVYFAGGEPLIMDEHYKVLEMLEDRKAYHVKLRYNTNFSEMFYRGVDVMKIWAKFESVDIGASLDASGIRGEYIRKEQNWNQVILNRQRMMEVCPEAEFRIACTVTLMNAWHLPDFFIDWIENEYIRDPVQYEWDFHIHPLHSPDYYNVRNLPVEFKEEITEKYHRLLYHPDGDKLLGMFDSVLSFMWKEDQSHLIPKFIEETERLDEIRNENFWEVFPELNFLQDFR